MLLKLPLPGVALSDMVTQESHLFSFFLLPRVEMGRRDSNLLMTHYNSVLQHTLHWFSCTAKQIGPLFLYAWAKGRGIPGRDARSVLYAFPQACSPIHNLDLSCFPGSHSTAQANEQKLQPEPEVAVATRKNGGEVHAVHPLQWF